MILFPTAKINLGLRILHRREDGFHNLETLFLPTALCDILEILPCEKVKKAALVKAKEDATIRSYTMPEGDYFIESGIPIDAPIEENNVLKLLRLLRNEGYSIPPVYIELHKIIPFGAGLGGGSADASFAFRALCSLFSLSLSPQRSIDLLAKIGSDCPFFLFDSPMLAQGRGEILEPFSLPQEIENSYLTIVKPPLFVSTREAYSNVPKYPSAKGELADLLRLPLAQWKDRVKNDFEESLFPLYPELRRLKNFLYQQGAAFALMSGSGSALFAISQHPLSFSYDTPLLDNCYIWQGRVVAHH